MHSVAVVPAYEEAATVGRVVDGVTPHVDEVVVVDDASTDETAAVARAAGATVLEHTFNTGVGGAVRTGYRYAIEHGFDAVVQVDADDQHDPADVPRLLDALERVDMVIASRYRSDSHEEYPLTRDLGIRFFTRVVNGLGGVDVTDVTSGFRAYRVSMLREVIHRGDRHFAVEQTLEAAKRGYEIGEVSAEMPTRETGQSQFTVDTLLLYPLRMTDAILRVLLFR